LTVIVLRFFAAGTIADAEDAAAIPVVNNAAEASTAVRVRAELNIGMLLSKPLGRRAISLAPINRL